MAFGDRFKNWVSSWGDDDYSDPYEDDPYAIGESMTNNPAFQAGLTDAGLSSLINDTFASTGINLDFLNNPEYFNFGDDDTAFNELLLNFDFDDPNADWGGDINTLLGYGDPNDPYGIGAGYENAFDSNTDYTILENLLFGEDPGGGETSPGEATSDGSGILGLIKALWGGANKAVGAVGSGIGSLLNSKVGQLALLNYLNNKRESQINIPIGQEAYGGGGDQADYRVMNLQPALMPGVAYANVAQPETPPPPMRHGGIASLASQEGPGDITLAKLEPGEFVMTKKATDNIGAQNLYRMMKQAEGGG